MELEPVWNMTMLMEISDVLNVLLETLFTEKRRTYIQQRKDLIHKQFIAYILGAATLILPKVFDVVSKDFRIGDE